MFCILRERKETRLLLGFWAVFCNLCPGKYPLQQTQFPCHVFSLIMLVIRWTNSNMETEKVRKMHEIMLLYPQGKCFLSFTPAILFRVIAFHAGGGQSWAGPGAAGWEGSGRQAEPHPPACSRTELLPKDLPADAFQMSAFNCNYKPGRGVWTVLKRQ